MQVLRRVATGIDGLDQPLEGGVHPGDVLVLAGGAGAGKSIFAAQFLYRGAVDYAEPGVYVTLEEDTPSMRRNMLNFGFDFTAQEEEQKIQLLDLSTAEQTKDLDPLLDFILDTVDRHHAKRLVIDSLTALLATVKGQFEYRSIMHLIYKVLK